MSEMARVTRARPCPVCNHGDWCLVGKSVIICMRVQSQREHSFKDGSYGWIHPIGDRQFVRPSHKPQPPRVGSANIEAIWNRMKSGTSTYELEQYSKTIGVSLASLLQIGCAVSGPMLWAFPMFSANRTIVGIRKRCSKTGKKFAEKGSHQGLFIPDCEPQSTLFAVEGPTDTAAALTIGLYAIGRPQCNGGILLLAEAVRLRPAIKQVVVIADADNDIERDDGSHWNPGVDGALATAHQMPVRNCILALPCKDMRQFVNQGGTKELVESLLKNCVWRKPNANQTRPSQSEAAAADTGTTQP